MYDLKDKIKFKGSRTSLHKLMRELGDRFKKVDKGRRILMERRNIGLNRSNFLRKNKENKEFLDPLDEIHIDETWVDQNEC